MSNSLKWWNSRLALWVAAITIFSSFMVFMDVRYALATDVQSLTNQIHLDRIERVEFKIASAERRMRKIILIPLAERTRGEIHELEEMRSQKELYLRMLKRVNSED